MKQQLTVVLLILSLVLGANGCTAARKQTPAPRPQVTETGVTDVTFSNIGVAEAPRPVQLLYELHRTRDTATLTESDQGLFVLVTRGNSKTVPALERLTLSTSSSGTKILDIKVQEQPASAVQPAQPAGQPLLARINLAETPDAVTFEFAVKATVTPSAPTAPAAPKAAPEMRKVPVPAPAPQSKPEQPKPAEPVEPGRPTGPEESEEPTEPEGPNRPTEPEEPNRPTEPEEPNRPTEPEEPGRPTGPREPANR